MFEGSQHHDTGYFQPLQGAGATLNGSTNADRTNYWEVVPADALELALWMESDRMGYLLPALTEAKFSNQRDVVLNERRQNYENRPYGLAPMAHAGGALSRRTIRTTGRRSARSPICTRCGSTKCARSSAATIIRRTRRSRSPATSTPTQALALVRRVLRRDRTPASASSRVRADGRRCRRQRAFCSRIASSCRACTSRGSRRRCSPRATPSSIWRPTCWPTARRRGCTAGSCSTSGMATDVSASQNSREIAGFVQITATAAPGHTLGELERSILEEIARLAADGPTDDGDRARPRAGRSAVHVPAADGRRLRRQVRSAERLQHVPGRSGVLRSRSRAVSGRDATRRCRRRPPAISTRRGRVTLSIVPQGRPALAAPDSAPAVVS